MKTILFPGFVLACLFTVSAAFADTLVFLDGHSITGSVLQTNGDMVLLLADEGAFNYSKANLKEIRIDQRPASGSTGNARLPTFRDVVLILSQQDWATNLTPIPATVIDKGVLKNIPYSSFHCGDDYEMNVYGDPEHPAGLEIGIYRKLLDNSTAKTNCLRFINEVLARPADKDMVWSLNWKSDYKLLDDLTFEITPPTEMDSYNGWWISVYSETELSHARATDTELGKITVAKKEALEHPSETNNASGWSVGDLKAARASTKTITFANSTGVLVTNAEVVRVIDGVSLIYRNGPTSGGMVRLADLPEDLRNEFGYDAAKTAAADELAKEDKARLRQQTLAAQQAQAAASVQDVGTYPFYGSDSDYGGGYSGGGRVYVHGYYRANGTYVNSYTRRYPSR